MKISGFSFIRNGIKFDYPFREAILSVLPLCDEFIVAVGNSDDKTRDAVAKLDNSGKLKIIDTVWDESLREGGRILAQQTDVAFDAISGDWGFYIQGDEVLHEKYIPVVRANMEKYLHDKKVEGLLFTYRHFYGSYDYVGTARRWYRREIRVVRNDKRVRSYKDAQGFRIDGRRMNVKFIPAEIYHYGWVKDPRTQQEKQKYFNKLWHDDAWVDKNVKKVDQFDYAENIDLLEKFTGTHPQVMRERLEYAKWDFQYRGSQLSLRDRISHAIEAATGWRIGEYKNYRIV